MNTTEIATRALELTVDYFVAHYDINENNMDRAAEVIAKHFIDNADKLFLAASGKPVA